MDTLRDMALFVEVAKTKNFTKAALNLAIPNSTLSRRIGVLEKNIGLRLFNRSTRRIELTDAGMQYFERCLLIVEEARIAHEQLQTHLVEPAGTLRVAMSVDFGTEYLAPILVAFAKTHPLINFELDLSPKKVNLMNEPMDVAIRMGEQPDSSLYIHKIGEVHTKLYASPQYLAEYPSLTSPEDMAHHQTINFSSIKPHNTWKLHHKYHQQPDKIIHIQSSFLVNSLAMAQRLAILGMGITTLSETMAQVHCENHHLQPVLPDWQMANVPIYAVTTSRLLPARVRVFIDYLVSQFR